MNEPGPVDDGEAQPADGSDGEAPAPPIRLLSGEEIVLDLKLSAWWTLGLYIVTLGLWTFWRKRHRILVTTQRLIVIKGIINKSEAVIPLERIQDVRLKTSPFFGGQVVLSSAGGGLLGVQRISQLTRADARELAHELNARVRGGQGL